MKVELDAVYPAGVADPAAAGDHAYPVPLYCNTNALG